MAYRASLIERAFVVRWTAEPVLADIAAIVNAVTTARRSTGLPILYLGIIGGNIPTPKSAVRDAFNGTLATMSELCACIDMLVEDTDIRATLTRTLLRAVCLVTPGRKMHCFGSVDEVAREWRRKYAVDVHAVLAAFHQFERTKVA